MITLVKKRKVSNKVDIYSNTQHFMDTKVEEMRITVYNLTLDQMTNGINIRFSQKTLDMIKSVANLLELNIDDNDITILTKTFNLEVEILKSEVNLLKHTNNLPKSDKKKCDIWISWLTVNTIYSKLSKPVIIPDTSCSWERTFSKLSLVKTK